MPKGYRTMDGIDLNDIWYGGAGIAAAVDLYQSVEMPLINALALPWPEQIMKYGISERNGFQVLGPGERPDRKTIDVATVYPVVAKYGYGVGTDLDTLQRSTGREIMLDMNRPMQEDPEHVLTRFMRVMMTTPGSNNAGYGFYNGQFAAEEKITAPPRYQQQTFAANHSHYMTSITASALVLKDITAMKQTVRHHGNKGTLLGFINSDTVQVLENLALFTNSAIIRSPITDEVAVDGFTDTFQLLGVTWHVTELAPANYVLIVEGNSAETQRPLIMFEPAAMRGLRLHPGPMNDYPLIESFWDRWFSLKVFRRGAGASLWFGAHVGTYTSPTFSF
jgi:hypothetical protein